MSKAGHRIPTLECPSREQIQDALAACERLLMETHARIRIVLDRPWIKERFPEQAGVYAAFEKGTLVYVGESESLRNRMIAMRSSNTHAMRWNIGEVVLKRMKGFDQALERDRFPAEMEKRLTDYIQKNLSIVAVIVQFGRKEIEEYMVATYQPRYNKKGKRT